MAARHGLTLVTVLAALGAAACRETPTSPGPSTGRGNYAPLEVHCLTAPELACLVRRFGGGDLTARAEWYATDQPGGTTTDPAVTFPRPGVPVAARPVKVYIAARVGTEARASSLSYEITPGAAPVSLAAVLGFTYEGDAGFAALDGVRVEIVSGPGLAATPAVSGINGLYTIPHVRVGVPFTIRASKTGYGSVDVQHAGIRVLSEGFPDTSTIAQHFRLNRR